MEQEVLVLGMPLGSFATVASILFSAGIIYAKFQQSNAIALQNQKDNVLMREENAAAFEDIRREHAEAMEGIRRELTEIRVIQSQLADGKARMDRIDDEVKRNREMMHEFRNDQNAWQQRMLDVLVHRLGTPAPVATVERRASGGA